MTLLSVKRLILLIATLVAMGGTTALLLSQLSQSRFAHLLGWLVFLSITILCTVWGWIFWREHTQTILRIHDQLRQFESSNQIGMIMVDAQDELSGLVREINRYLTNIKYRFERNLGQGQELRLQIKAAEAERHQAEAVIESINDAVIVINRYGELQLANPAAEDMFDFRLDRYYQMPLEAVIAEREIVELIQKVHQENRTIKGQEIIWHHPVSGETLDLKLSISCVNDARLKIDNVVLSAHDITHEKEVNRLKDDFVNSVSHELKTPLASIQAYAEILADNEIDVEETRRRFCEIIQEQTDRLNRLIDDILNASRLESGLLEVDLQPLNVLKLVQTVQEMIQPQSEKKQIEIVLDIYPEDLTMLADHDLMYQALLNLLHNAIKYSEAQRHIGIRAYQHDDTSVVVEITDQGVGIPSDALDHIFDKFYRVPQQETMASGTGLGLHLVKEIVQNLHHGHIQVESVPDEGTTFVLSVPSTVPIPI